MADILVVEDDDVVRALVTHTLTQYGYSLDGAGSGEDALAKLSENEYELVILDVNLGRMTGWEVLEEMKRRRLREQTKVVMLTAQSQERDILKGWRLGVDQYCTKPFDLDEFVVTVQDVLLSTREQLIEQRRQELQRAELLHMVDTAFGQGLL